MDEQDLLSLCHDLIERARGQGAKACEAIATSGRKVESTIENNDIHTVQTTEETVFGLRVILGERLGFITSNRCDPQTLGHSARQAVEQAKAMPADPFNRLPEPRATRPVAGLYDERIACLTVGDTTRLARGLLDRVRTNDQRVRVDSGFVRAASSTTAVVSTTGISLAERESVAEGYVFGMAVDGDEVASFDYDGDATRRRACLEAALEQAADRFCEKCLGGLGATTGSSFKGEVVFSPEAVEELLLSDLIVAISADAIRKGRSALAGRLGQQVASEAFTLCDDGSLEAGVASTAFDREGVPVLPCTLIEGGVLRSYLFNQYEAQAAGNGARSTGHATGSAATLPGIGPTRLDVAAGTVPLRALIEELPRTVIVNRFSGSSSPVNGDFSGVVKNGFLIEGGRKKPVKEILIAGNLFEALQRITGVSAERRILGGIRLLPAIRVDGISVTAG